MTTDFYWVYMTVPSEDAAKKIGRALLENRLAACVNMVDRITSMYWWKNEIQEDRETILIAKTEKSRLSRLMEKVRALHEYECPCIVALPIQDGFPDYLAWLAGETRDQAEEPRGEAI